MGAYAVELKIQQTLIIEKHTCRLENSININVVIQDIKKHSNCMGKDNNYDNKFKNGVDSFFDSFDIKPTLKVIINLKESYYFC